MEQKSPYTYKDGLKDGIPIAVGYLSVSFGFGITAVTSGIKIFESLVISLLNLTSAGQVAGVNVIAAGGTFLAVLSGLLLAEFVINIRYSLMGATLTQKLDPTCTTKRRLFMSFGLTDEIFGVAVSKPHPIGPNYFYGLMTLPYVGWASGTLLGAIAGEILPERLRLSLGIAVYAMFVAIILPPMKKSLGIALTVGLSVLFNCVFTYVPFFDFLPSTISLIIGAVAASLLLSYFLPVSDEEEGQEGGNGNAV